MLDIVNEHLQAEEEFRSIIAQEKEWTGSIIGRSGDHSNIYIDIRWSVTINDWDELVKSSHYRQLHCGEIKNVQLFCRNVQLAANKFNGVLVWTWRVYGPYKGEDLTIGSIRGFINTYEKLLGLVDKKVQWECDQL